MNVTPVRLFRAISDGSYRTKPYGSTVVLDEDPKDLEQIGGPRFDPITTHFMSDDFVGGGVAQIGDLGWSLLQGTLTTFTSPPITNPGVVRLGTVATTGQNGELTPREEAYYDFDSMFDMIAIMRPEDVDSNARYRWGLFENLLGNHTEGAYFEKEFADTNWHVVTMAASSVTRVDTGVAVVSQYDRFRIRRIDNSSIGFRINNGPEIVTTLTQPTGAAFYEFFMTTNESVIKRLAIDYADFHVTSLKR